MTEADLLPLLLDVNQDIDTQFQFWISITFAVLVASFVANGLAQPELPALAGLLRFTLFTLGSLVTAFSVLFPKFGSKRREAQA